MSCLRTQRSAPARARTRSARSGVQRTNHLATAPPIFPRYIIKFSGLTSAVRRIQSYFELIARLRLSCCCVVLLLGHRCSLYTLMKFFFLFRLNLINLQRPTRKPIKLNLQMTSTRSAKEIRRRCYWPSLEEVNRLFA